MPQITAEEKPNGAVVSPTFREAFLSLNDEAKLAVHNAAIERVLEAEQNVLEAEQKLDRCRAFHKTTMAQLRTAFAGVMRNALMVPGVPIEAVKEARDFERALKTL